MPTKEQLHSNGLDFKESNGFITSLQPFLIQERVIQENLFHQDQKENNLPEKLNITQQRRRDNLSTEFHRLAKQVRRSNHERFKVLERREEASSGDYGDHPRPFLSANPNYVYTTSWPHLMRILLGNQQVIERDMNQWHLAEEPVSIKSWHIAIQSLVNAIFEWVPNLLSSLQGPHHISCPLDNDLEIKWFHGAGQLFAALVEKQPRMFRAFDLNMDIEIYICYARSLAKTDYYDSLSDLFDEIVSQKTYKRPGDDNMLVPLTAMRTKFGNEVQQPKRDMPYKDDTYQGSLVQPENFWELVELENPNLKNDSNVTMYGFQASRP